MEMDKDFNNFLTAIDHTAKVIGKKYVDDDVAGAWFSVLEAYSFENVTKALSKLVLHPDSKWGITPALIVECMSITEEREMTWQMVVNEGRKPVTPMGVMVRLYAIKSFEFNNSPDHHLKEKAMCFLDSLPEYKARALSGDYTKDEMIVMIDKNIDPTSPFCKGMPKYQPLEHLDPMRISYRAALDSPVHKENVARAKSREQNGIDNPEGRLKVQAELKKLFADVKTQVEYTGAEAAQILEDDLK